MAALQKACSASIKWMFESHRVSSASKMRFSCRRWRRRITSYPIMQPAADPSSRLMRSRRKYRDRSGRRILADEEIGIVNGLQDLPGKDFRWRAAADARASFHEHYPISVFG